MAGKIGKQYVSDNAQLMAEWNWEKNNELAFDPKHLSCGSAKKVWWICSKGHEWQAWIAHRYRGVGCPYCAGRKVLIGINDLQTVNPSLAQEWYYEKNSGLTPQDVLPGSNRKAWWICRKGHIWHAVIANRNKGIGCPICSSERNTSFPEYALIFYLKQCELDVLHSYKEYGYELDVYIPSKRVAIEYDGYYWHKNTAKKDLQKNYKCKKHGIKLYRIREGLSPLNDSSVDYVIQKNQKDLLKSLGAILYEITGISVDVDLNRDAIAIENLREFIEKENSLLYSNATIAQEWHYERNGKLRPEHYLPNSSKRVWWKCSKGHEWQATIDNRNYGYGCPYCSGRYAIKGENDLQTVNPNLAKEWDYDRNNGLTPMDVLPNSDRKVWWKCAVGHEWKTQVKVRARGNGCPYCSGKRAIKGQNDLQTINPVLAQEWNYNKNGYLFPENVLANSGKRVWWKCSKGHEWQQTIDKRNNGIGCPYCSNYRVLRGYNDLASVNPSLAKEWNYSKNGNCKPEDFIANSGKIVWWLCSKGHEWQTTIINRNRGTGCPYCSGRKVLQGFNDLQTMAPTLAAEWNFSKNGNLTPYNFTANSGKKVWWICKNGHEWQATIANRNYGNGCPVCINKSILIGYNDLVTSNPALANEWDYDKNLNLIPENFTANSGKKVWWICENGHEWQAIIASRNKGYGCPQCAREKRKLKK